MPKFYVCDVVRGTPCVFSEASMKKLWERSGGYIARCIRHGCLICNETCQENKKKAQAWAKGETCKVISK